MSLLDSLNDFNASVHKMYAFNAIAFETLPTTGAYIRTQDERNFITDSSFLRLFIAWETFIEGAFIKYSIGLQSISGNIVAGFVSPPTAEHASKLFIGTQKYVDWANPEIVRKLSQLYFVAGNPFEIYFNAIFTSLSDLKHIRNAAAHLTSTTNTQLNAIASRRIGRTVVMTSVSDFIFRIDPISKITYLEGYVNELVACATGIANN